MTKTQQQELQEAIAQKRQPNCVWCGAKLTVCQRRPEYRFWDWDEANGEYRQSDDLGDPDKPHCAECGAEDWEFLNNGEETAKLGLEY